MMAHVISLLNMKGGVGKTTLAVELASRCFSRGRKKVLLVDLDPQFNASQYLMKYNSYAAHCRDGGTIADLLLDSPNLHLRKRKAKKKSFRDCVYRVKQRVVGACLDLLPSQ